MCAAPSLWLELTPSCNLKCVFCYNPWRGGSKSDYPPPQSYEELLTGASRLLDRVAFQYVALSGGEPLLYPALASLVSWLRDRGQETILTTNGRLLTEAKLSALRDAGLGAVHVSLLGSRSRTHNALAGRSSYQQALRAMAFSRAAGLATSATFIATGPNLYELPQVVELVSWIGLTQLVVNELQPVGSATHDLGRLGTTTEQFDSVLDTARHVGERRGVDVIAIRSASAWQRGDIPDRGWRRWSISPDGHLKLCNHASRSLGRLEEMADGDIDHIAGALAAGEYERFSGHVDNCLCFQRAVLQRQSALETSDI